MEKNRKISEKLKQVVIRIREQKGMGETETRVGATFYILLKIIYFYTMRKYYLFLKLNAG